LIESLISALVGFGLGIWVCVKNRKMEFEREEREDLSKYNKIPPGWDMFS